MKRKKQLKKDTTSKIKSLVDEGKHEQIYEQSEEFQKELKLKVEGRDVAYGTRVKVSSSLSRSSLLSFFAGVKSKEEDRFTNPDPSTSRAIDAKTSEFASGLLGLSSLSLGYIN
ncbi:hypothetical protein Bca101_094954 [Brassica carinata]